jgi:hypothetical protein
MSTISRAVKSFAREHFTRAGISRNWAKFKGKLVRSHNSEARLSGKSKSDSKSDSKPEGKGVHFRKAQESVPNPYVSVRFKEVKPDVEVESKPVSSAVEKLTTEEVEALAIKALQEFMHSVCVGTPEQRIYKLSEIMRHVHTLCLENKGPAFGVDDIAHTLEDLLNRIPVEKGMANVLARELSSSTGAMQDLFAVQLVAYYRLDGQPKARQTELSLSNHLSHTANECIVMTPVLIRLLAEKVARGNVDEIIRQFAYMKDPSQERLRPVFNAMLRVE